MFPHTFHVLWKSFFFHVLGTAWSSSSSKKKETLDFEMPVFSQMFSLLWEFTFPIIWELYALMPWAKYARDLWLWKVRVFPEVPLTMKIQISHGILWVSITHEIKECGICNKTKTFKIFVFSHNFPVLSKFTIPMF